MKKLLFTLALLTALIFSSCSSDEDKTESTGISTGNYWPLVVNNSWTYFGEGLNSEIKIVGTQVFNGKTYYEITDNANTDFDIKSWILKEGAVYFLKADEASAQAGSGIVTIESYEIPFFKDNLAKDASWTGSISPKVTYKVGNQTQNLSAKITYKGLILATDATETINDVVYENVIKTRLRLTILVNNQTTESLVEYTFAKDVGPIKTYEIGNGISISRTLIDYNLN